MNEKREVPLTWRDEDGKVHVLGTAEVNEDGTFTSRLSASASEMFSWKYEGFSFGPPHTGKLHEISIVPTFEHERLDHLRDFSAIRNPELDDFIHKTIAERYKEWAVEQFDPEKQVDNPALYEQLKQVPPTPMRMGIAEYQSPILHEERKDMTKIEITQEELDAHRANSPFQVKAMNIVLDYFNEKVEKTDGFTLTAAGVYVVWFSKTLQNWKALVSTVVSDGMYYEVTYDGEKKCTYLDAYKKFDNRAIPDEDGVSRPTPGEITWGKDNEYSWKPGEPPVAGLGC